MSHVITITLDNARDATRILSKLTDMEEEGELVGGIQVQRDRRNIAGDRLSPLDEDDES